MRVTLNLANFWPRWATRPCNRTTPTNMKTRLSPSVWTVIVATLLAVLCAGCIHQNRHSAYREIHGAARDGDVAQVAGDLAQNPGDLNLPDDAGLTPLHLAASHCHSNVVTVLLDKGAKIDYPAKDGTTPLHLAAQEGCADAVALFIARGAQVNARDNQKRTPLVRAQQWHQDPIVQLLRQHGGIE